jgi:zinc transporter ZupT
MTSAFYGDMVIILIVEYVVHHCFKRHGVKRHSHGEAPPEFADIAREATRERDVQAAVDSAEKDHTDGSKPTEAGLVQVSEVAADVAPEAPSGPGPEANCIGESEEKGDFKRAGIMTGIAMAIHNFLECIALFVSSLRGLKTGLVLSIGIILHNIPRAWPSWPRILCHRQQVAGLQVNAREWICTATGRRDWLAVVSGGMSYALEAPLYGVVAGMLMTICAKELFSGSYRFDPSGKYFVPAFFTDMGIIVCGHIVLHSPARVRKPGG